MPASEAQEIAGSASPRNTECVTARGSGGMLRVSGGSRRGNTQCGEARPGQGRRFARASDVYAITVGDGDVPEETNDVHEPG